MSSLFIVATPIGNLEDITQRALRVLSEVQGVVAEDTRITTRLLRHYHIEKKLSAWHEHSDDRAWQRLKEMLASGASLAYVTDSGTPGLSDPGGRLVELVRTELPEVQIVPVPGPSALATAVSIAGIPLHEFLFFGFLPHKKGRQTKLTEIGASDRPVILYESVHRIRKLLSELARTDKQVIVCRELTKQFETVYRGSPADVAAKMPASETKGEFVVIVF
ncbi:MAG: 16S rRNA (cytidine(1402)-2'-O)-methyltransferase [Patescibacteria group bacterium]